MSSGRTLKKGTKQWCLHAVSLGVKRMGMCLLTNPGDTELRRDDARILQQTSCSYCAQITVLGHTILSTAAKLNLLFSVLRGMVLIAMGMSQ